MAAPSPSFTIPIPPEYQGDLEYVEVTDTRSDEGILAGLGQYAPVTSEKNVWAYWDKGLAAMPEWCKRNVASWVRILGPSWTVRVLDTVPDSPNHALRYLDADLLPEAFVKGTMDGPYAGPHSADLLRGAALYLHGGVWMDVGIILIRHLDRVFWDALADEQSPFNVAIPNMHGRTVANCMVASRKGDPFIKRWHDLFVHVWKGRTNCGGLIEHPLLQGAISVSLDDSKQANFGWNFKVSAETVFEYIGQVVCWSRLCHLEDAGDGFKSADYWENNVLVFSAIEECWAAEGTIGFDSKKLLDLLRLPLDSDPSTPEYATAHKLVWRLLTRSSMQKVTHGVGLTHEIAMGTRWEMPGNETADCAPGTFAWLLRQGSLRFRQTRKEIALTPAPPVPQRRSQGLYEPFV